MNVTAYIGSDAWLREMNATSAHYRARTLKALTETCEALAKEMAYSPAARKADRIAFLTGHIAHLEGTL